MIAYNWGKKKISEHKAYFILKCRISHVIYWLLYWNWKTEQFKCIDSYTRFMAPAQFPAKVSYYISLIWEKNQNSELKVYLLLNAYHVCTIAKLKSQRLNHRKWGSSVLDSLFIRQNKGTVLPLNSNVVFT